MSAAVDSSPRSRFVYSTSALSLLVVTGLWLFRVQDACQVALPLAAILLAAVSPLPFRRWSAMDWLVALLTAFDVASCFYSACPVPALQQASFSVCCLTAYLAARRLWADPGTAKLLFYGSYVPAVPAVGVAVCSFFVFRSSVLEAGFADTYAFRFLFRPLGYITNQWAEVLLLLLGWLCLARRHASVFVFLTDAALCLSFSRGAYLALGAFVLAWLAGMRPWREALRVPLLCLSAAVCIGVCFPQETQTTLRMNATVSQQQSTQARMGATRAAWEAFRQSPCPLFGQGNGSYSLAIDPIQNQDSTQTYTGIAPNLPILLLVEKGWVGLVLYGLCFVTVCRLLWTHRRETGTYAVACTLLAVGIKEMTQANLFNLPSVWLLVCLMLAFLQRTESGTEPARGNTRYIVPAGVLAFYGVFVVCTLNAIRRDRLCAEAVEAFQANRPDDATACLEQTGNGTPHRILRGLCYAYSCRKTGRKEEALRALAEFQAASGQQPRDVHLVYLQAYACLLADRPDQARPLLEGLVRTYPANSLYRMGLWKCLCHDGHKQAALPHLVEAIRLTPRLLTHPDVEGWIQADTSGGRALRRELSRLTLPPSASPADRARMGYIAHWNGEEDKAEACLRQAVEALPNLSTPWRLLGEERKYRLLLLGAFRKNLFTMPLPEEPALTDELLLAGAYGTKFTDWYGCRFLLFGIDKESTS